VTGTHNSGGSSAAPDGGFAALTGFLHQMLGAAQAYVRAAEPGRKSDDGGVATLLCFEHEVHQQDTAAVTADARGTRRRTLTQYKVSLSPAQYPIRPTELRKIADGLRKSRDAADRVAEMPTRLVLRTNRPLSPQSCSLLNAANPAVASPQYVRRKVSRGDGGPSSRQQRKRPLLAGLRVEQFDARAAREELEAYAARFGMYQDDELAAGVRRVVDRLFETATSQADHRISRADFDRALAGYASPRPLTIAEHTPRLLEDLNRQRGSQLGV
jgi:hypothetical protein